MQRIIIDNLRDLQPFYSQPVTLKGLTGVIDSLVIMGCKTDYDQFLLTLLDCDGLRIRELVLEGQHSGLFKEHWIEYAPNGLHLLSKNVTIERVSLHDLHNAVVMRGKGCRVLGGDVTDVSGDFVQICADDCLVQSLECSGSLDVFGAEVHRDVVQLFPDDKKTLHGCTVSGVTYRAGDHKWDARPQGILASDGKFTGIEVTDCRLVGVHDSHGISFLVDAVGCRLSDNVTNGLIRIDETLNDVSNNQIIGHNLDQIQTKGFFMSNKMNKEDALIQWASDELKISTAKVKAVFKTETQGNKDHPLFERHKFLEQLKLKGIDTDELISKNPALVEIINPIAYKRGGNSKDSYGKFAKQYERIEWAKRIDTEAALKATSWGRPQIMGFNHKLAGFDDVFGFVEAMKNFEGQVSAFVTFIKSSRLDEPLQKGDFAAFAEGYNGKAYKGEAGTKEDDYDWKMSRNYQLALAEEQAKKPLTKSKTVVTATTGIAVSSTAAVATWESVSANLETLQDGLSSIADNAAAVKALGGQVAELTSSVSSFSWLPWFVVGSSVLTMLLFAFVIYVYLVDRGYIKSSFLKVK